MSKEMALKLTGPFSVHFQCIKQSVPMLVGPTISLHFIKDELLRRADEQTRIGLWEFLQLFFPEETNKKQFDCASKFNKILLEAKTVESTKLKEIVESDYVNLTTIVLPKLEKFGLIKIEGERGKGKAYAVRLNKTFSDRIRYIGMGGFRLYAKYGDTNGW